MAGAKSTARAGRQHTSLEQADTATSPGTSAAPAPDDARHLSRLASEARRGDALAPERLAMEAIKARLFPGEAAPAKIGRFTVLRQIGAGGMSVVYAAYDERLDRRIAVKLLRSGESADNQARLLREAQAMARLSHPNVVAVHEVGAWEQQVYVAMEFVRGPNLRDWLQAVPRDIREIREVFVAAGRGLAAAHHAGLVHRDFKPANVLVGDDGRVRVGDFGLVRHAGDEPLEAPAPAPVPTGSIVQAGARVELSTTLTETGAILGTPAYMSPEQHLGRPVDARSDQFSFCVALYEALYGAPPFAGRDLLELARRVLAGAVSPVPEDSKVPAWLRRAVLRGLAVDPAARWPSIDDLLDELERDPERAWRTRRSAALVGLAVVGVVVGLLVVARERADAAAQAQRAEAAAERQRRTAEDERAAAEQERDRAFIDAKAQLAEAQRAQAALKDALAAAEAQRLNAEAHAALAEHALSEAERRRREAEAQRKEAERQTGRAVHEAARARDANRLAQALAGARGDPTTVLALLREVEDPAAAPGWVPAAVSALQHPVSAAVLRGRGAALLTAAFSPDGARLAAAGEDRRVTLWSWPDDHVLKIHEHQGPVRAVAFAPGGELVSGAENGAAVWRDPPVRLPAGAGDDLRAFALAPDGRTLVTGGGDGRVRAWDLEAAPPRPRELARHEGPVHAVLFDRTGHLVASAGADGAARIVDLRGGPPRSLPHPSGAVRSAAFSPDGRRLATGAQDGLVRVWDAQGEGAPALLRGHADEVVALAWSPDGERLASASLDRTARLWTAGGAPRRTLRGHDGRVYALAWSPGGDRLVTASQDGTARVWPVDGAPVPGDMPLILRGHGEAVVAAGFSPSGDHVVTASRDGTARVWRVRGGDPLVRAVPLGGPVDHLVWTAAGLYAVRADGRALHLAPAGLPGPGRRTSETGREDDVSTDLPPKPSHSNVSSAMPMGTGLIDHGPQDMPLEPPMSSGADPSGPARVAALAGPESPSLFLGTGPNGHVLTLTRAGALQGWDDARRPLKPRPLDPAVAAAAVAPDLARAALAVPDGARLFDLTEGTSRPLTGHRGSVTALAFSPDGRQLATGAADRTARLYSAHDPAAAPREFGPHSGSVTVLAFSPDGQRLATGSWDRRVRIWPLAGGAPTILEEHSGPVRALAWRPDGAALATASDDATVRVWPLDGRDEPVVLTGHQGPVRALAWAPASPHLASAGDDGQLRLWTADFAPATLKARLRAASPVCLSARQRGQLLGEPPGLAEANATACQSGHEPGQ
ncbi:protein kinase domain-containing protein [Nannocystis punicea]|uniref:Protein kinase n=1 Tax=Nannocystis punicea TaxID=2995304 RepID=A0ABY7HIL6_9BACT|nr:protein kinase [Nannocystis poenicansa]WAS98912.1 protein kinase [Nannocystis poenicansa]